MMNWTFACGLATWLFLAGTVSAQDKGQAELDKATELQLSAQSLGDLEKVADLCEQAIAKGLGEDNKKFATELLVSTLLDHARRLSTAVLDEPPPARWQAIRNNAVRDLDRVLKHEPHTAEAHFMRAKLLLLPGGDPAEVRKALDFAIKDYEKLEDERENLAKALLMRSELTEDKKARLVDIEAALKAAPGLVDAWQARAAHYLDTGEIEKGVADLKRLVEAHGELLPVRIGLVQALAKLEKYDEALAQLDEVQKQRDDVPAVYMLRAQILVQQKKLDAAIETLDDAVKLDPRNLGSLFMRAEVHAQREAWKDAERDLNLILNQQPGQPQAILLLSGVFAEQKKYREAVNAVNDLLKKDPDNVPLRTQAAQLLLAGGWPRAAIRQLTQLLQDDPGNWMVLRARADAYLNIGKHAEAIADFNKAMEAQPKNHGILNNLAWVLATSPDDKLRDAKRSLELGKQACEVTDHKMAHILSTLASAYAESGDFETAIKWSTKAVELSPDNENKEQLGKELESYKNKKPWRELQENEEKPNPPTLAGDKDEL